MSAHLKAFVGVVIVLAVIGIGFAAYYRMPAEPSNPSLDRVEVMRRQGAPDFAADDLDKKSFKLSEHKGKIIILNFWASWCEPCVEEVPSLINLVQKMNGKVELVAVSGDNERTEIDSFLKSFPGLRGSHVTLIWDNDKKIVQKYGVERLPESFILNGDLKLVKKVVGSVRWDQPESLQYFNELTSQSK